MPEPNPPPNPPLADAELELHRRQHARLSLGIPARFDTLDGRQQVRLVDLSRGGAHIVLQDETTATEGVLGWMEFETFGIVAWQEGENVGLEFDRPLSDACFAATRDFAPEIFREAARAFVAGMDGMLR
jgi:hypothetical protein